MSWIRPARSALLLAAAAATLSACAMGKVAPRGASAPSPHATTPLDQYAVKVQPKSEDLGLTPHAFGLSAAQKDALADYAAAWRESNGDVIVLKTPPAAACNCDARITARAAHDFLITLGVPGEAIRIAEYDGAGRPDAPVLASYTHLGIESEDCTKRWSNLVSTHDNSVSANFGCAMTQNMAAMVADPRDLLRPHRVDPSDGARRDVVLDKYRKGTLTSSAKDEQAAGTLSNAVH